MKHCNPPSIAHVKPGGKRSPKGKFYQYSDSTPSPSSSSPMNDTIAAIPQRRPK